MAKTGKKTASARRRAKTSPRDLSPRKVNRGGAGSVLIPRVKWEPSDLDAVKR